MEIKRVLDSDTIMLRISQCTKHTDEDSKVKFYLEGMSLHYMFRPKVLENLSLYDFCLNYEVKRSGYLSDLIDDQEKMRFENGHPGKEYQYVKLRNSPVIAGINNWEFIDTARFGYDWLESDIEKDES
jgi:hypothetical protein